MIASQPSCVYDDAKEKNGVKMKRTLRISFIILLIMIFHILVFTSCDSINNIKDPGNEMTSNNATTETIHTHAWGEWQTIIEATCTAEGKQERTCECGEAETQIIAALGHDEVIHDAKAPTCTEVGWDAYVTCSRCNYSTYVEKPALGHTISAWIVDKDATCTNDGTKHQVCATCGETITRIIPATGHRYTSLITAPTKTEQGYTTHTCSVCGDTYIDSYVEATGSLGLAYSVNADGTTCTVTGIGTCTDTEVFIPSSITVYKVTAIGENAFAECEKLTFINIPNTVKTIGMRAFYACSEITEITIPSSVTSIGMQIFYKCTSLTTVYYNSTYSSSNNPFLYVSSIKKVVFGGTSVPSDILRECTNITEVVISDGVTTLSSSAFYKCTSLKHITIPNSVTSIGDYAFRECTNLMSITIPDSVTSIGNYAFCECTKLTSITIPDSVTSIGNASFQKCTNLANVTIGKGVTSISHEAFHSCSNLTNIIIPDSVTSIANFAFSGCSSLTSITIPKSVTSIGGYAFWICRSLTRITYTGITPEWVAITKGVNWNEYTGHYTIYCTDGTITKE